GIGDHEADHVVGVSGGRDRLDLEALGLERGRHHRQVELLLVLDVVGVGVRAEEVGQPEAVGRDELGQRRDRGGGSGEAGGAPAKKRLELQYTSMQQQGEKLDGQARDAVKANREDLAREALTRKAAIEGQLGAIMQQGQDLEAQQQKLVEGEKTLSARVES